MKGLRYFFKATPQAHFFILFFYFALTLYGSEAKTISTRKLEQIVQNAHSDKVYALAFSPDGRIVASAGADMRIKLWDAAGGALLRTLTGHGDRVESVMFSADGRLLASSSQDKTIRTWDIFSGSPLHTFTVADQEIAAMAISQDGSVLAGSSARTVHLWDTIKGKLLAKIERHPADLRQMVFSRDGKQLVSVSSDEKTRVWDASTGDLLRTFAAGSKEAFPGLFSPNGNLRAVSKGKSVEVRTIPSDKLLHAFSSHDSEVLSFAFSPDEKMLACGGRDGTIKLWDIEKGVLLRAIAGHGGRFGWIYAVAFSPDGQSIASASEDRTVKLWKTVDGSLLFTLGAPGDRVEAVTFPPGGKMMIAGGLGLDGDIQIWDMHGGGLLRTLAGKTDLFQGTSLSPQEEAFAVKSLEDNLYVGDRAKFSIRSVHLNFDGGAWWYGEAVKRILLGYTGTARTIGCSPDGKKLVSGSLSRLVTVWDLDSGSQGKNLTAHSGYIRAVAFSPDGKKMASGGEDQNIKIWDAASYYLLQKIVPAHNGSILALAFSPESKQLASSAENENSIKLWDASTGILQKSLNGHSSEIHALAFVPGKNWLISAGGDRTIRFWETSADAPIRTITETGWPISIAVSPDAKMLGEGTHEGEVKIWDCTNGSLRHTLKGHAGPVWSVAFSPDGKILASGSDDTTIKYWDIEAGELLVTISGRGRDWLVTTPDGLFDGAPQGWSGLRWRFSENLFDTAPVELFFNEFYYPGLLAEIMSGKRPKAPRDIAKIDRRQPEIKISLAGNASPASPITTGNVKIRIAADEAPPDQEHTAGSGMRDLRLFRNGSLVKVWRGDVLQAGQKSAVLEADIPIVAGENRLTAYAFNSDNIKSRDAALLLTGADTLKRRGVAYVLAVGVNRYANADYNLKYAAADAQAFAGEFEKRQGELKSFAEIRVISLLDNAATKVNILEALDLLSGRKTSGARPGMPADFGKIKPVQPEDAVVIYFAGHGAAAGSRFYLIPHDLGYAGPRTSLNEAGLKAILASSISDQDLEQALEKVDAGQLLLVIDACNSGQALETEEKRRGPMNSRGLAQLAYEKGMSILTAAQGYQAALEAARLGHGYLTYALVEEGLKGEAADREPRDGQVLLREWLDYATLRVPQMQEAGMREARELKHELVFVEGEEKIGEVAKRSLQRPRVFYRREPETRPLVIKKIEPGR